MSRKVPHAILSMMTTVLPSLAGFHCAGVYAQERANDQAEFVEVVESAKRGISQNAPVALLDAMLDRRGYRLCEKIRSPAIVDWLGTVWHVGITPGGSPTIAILIAPAVGVTTFTGTNEKDLAAGALIAKGTAIAADLVGLKPGEKVRFSGSLIFSDNVRCFASLPGNTDLFAPAFYVQLRTIYRASDGPALAARPAPGTGVSEPSAGERLTMCKADWAQCEDNRQLADNYEQYGTARRACRAATDGLTKYGAADWTGFAKDLFGTYTKGFRYVTTGVAELVEPDVPFNDGRGTMARVRVSCLYDLKSQRVIHVFGEPK